MRSFIKLFIPVLTMLTLVFIVGCERDDSTVRPASFPSESDVFTDGFGPGVDFQAFSGSKLDALAIDEVETFSGSASMSFSVPDGSDPQANFAGGAFVSHIGRDLSGFETLSFYAKASINATIGVAGFGNDNTGTSQFTVERYAISISTSWEKISVPIPYAERLGSEGGLFHIAAGAVDGTAYTIWIDEVVFESPGTIVNPEATLASQTLTLGIGSTVSTGNLIVAFDDLGTELVVSAMPSYFDFASSDESVATVAMDGTITAIASGTADITAELNGVPAEGSISLVIGEAAGSPAAPADAPDFSAEDVISLFSNEYTDVPIDTWSADWDMADLEDIVIAGDDIKHYSNLAFAGIEFGNSTINASEMTHFHFDMWTSNTIDAGSEFKVKLVDFGADGVFEGGDDVEHELTFAAGGSPGLVTANWIEFDIPLSTFTSLTTTGSVAQLIFSGNLTDIFVDNILFRAGEDVIPDQEPTSPAATPTHDAANVTSLFSNAYDNVEVDTWSAEWDEANVEDVQVSGDDIKKYTDVVFAGIEFTTQTVDATDHNYLHFDFWTPDPTNGGQTFSFKLVDFGPDGAFDGGDDSESSLTFDANSEPALATSQWVSFDIPLEDFIELAGRSSLAQIVFEGDPNTVFLDNIIFYTDDGGGGDSPSSPAPTPTYAAGNVVSLFCDEYDDVPVDTWSAPWPDDADVEDTDIDGNAVKLYTNTVFAGIEFTSPTVNASAMTHFRMDIWTPDSTDLPAIFKIKLVDFGADGEWQGGDDSEHELTFDANSVPALRTGQWVTFNIPLSDFTGMTGRTSIAQLIFVSDPGPDTIYVDNVLFHN
jgi:Bacterial Ig-like domain (group 2)